MPENLTIARIAQYGFSRARRAKKEGRSFSTPPPPRFPGRVLLSRDAFGHSTIGAEGLNCRVRDGNGCFTFAMATGKLSALTEARAQARTNLNSRVCKCSGSNLICDSTFAVPSG